MRIDKAPIQLKDADEANKLLSDYARVFDCVRLVDGKSISDDKKNRRGVFEHRLIRLRPYNRQACGLPQLRGKTRYGKRIFRDETRALQ